MSTLYGVWQRAHARDKQQWVATRLVWCALVEMTDDFLVRKWPRLAEGARVGRTTPNSISTDPTEKQKLRECSCYSVFRTEPTQYFVQAKSTEVKFLISRRAFEILPENLPEKAENARISSEFSRSSSEFLKSFIRSKPSTQTLTDGAPQI